MKLKCRVNQALCLANGIDAPASTFELEVNPADLTQIERDVLASHLNRGHDLTKDYGDCIPSLSRTDVLGLRLAIAQYIDARDKRAAEVAAREVRNAASLANVIARASAAPIENLINSDMTERLIYNFWNSVLDGTMDWDPSRNGSIVAETHREAEAAAYREEKAAEAEREKAAREAKAKARADAIEGEYRPLYMRLPQALRERDKAGFASSEEVTRALRSLIRADAGLSEYGAWKWDNEAKNYTLTDEQFSALEEFKKLLPAGATVEVKRVWDDGDQATDDNGDYETDDGDPVYEIINERTVAKATWERAGVQVSVVKVL